MHGTRSGIDGSLVKQLADAGISFDDALSLRKISMTLHRWHELECGDGNQWASWCITRGHKRPEGFDYDAAGKPYLEKHLHSENHARYEPIADRENSSDARFCGSTLPMRQFTLRDGEVTCPRCLPMAAVCEAVENLAVCN